MVKSRHDDEARAATQPLKDGYPQTPRPRTVSAPGVLLAGRYRLLGSLGSGGMGTVYEGEHVLLGHRVAVKMLHPHYAQSEASTKRFMNEARAAAQLRHPNVARCDDVGVTPEGHPFLVLELLEGRDLADELADAGTLEISRALNIARQVASALGYAHSQGVVHRDLKPENIFLARVAAGSEQVKVLDFGVARFIGLDHTSGTRTGAAIGTPFYMAPEQFTDASRAEAEADIYALGVVLYEMLTGHRPFEAATLPELLSRMSSGTFRRLEVVLPALPHHIAETIHSALSADPRARPRSMEEFVARLDGKTPAGQISYENSPPQAQSPGRLTRKQTITRVVALLCLFALGAVAFFAYRSSRPAATTTVDPGLKAKTVQEPSPENVVKSTNEAPKLAMPEAPSTESEVRSELEKKASSNTASGTQKSPESARQTERRSRRTKRPGPRDHTIADEPDF